MGATFENKTLSSGKSVSLVHWNDLAPVQHGATLQSRPWKDSDTRASLSFYPSTAEYMHNDWAQAHMAPQKVTLDGKGSLMLFHNAQTDTWHSADALDIDHKTEWKPYFADRGVASHADAQMAYNDVNNLRLMPAPVNRARESAFHVLETHGADSTQWRKWVDERFAFDPSTGPCFDPEVDGAKRKRTTMEQPWRPEDGRKGLSFDTAVLGKWFNDQLGESHAATVQLKSPTTGRMIDVPLFHCGASGQLCTRDALDIDHHIPFELLGPEMAKHAPSGGLSKADALDGYNESSNLRLVGRTVNSSHDFEMDLSGEYRDERIAPEKKGEFSSLLAKGGDGALSAQMKQEIRELASSYRVPTMTMEHPSHPGNRLYSQALSGLEKSEVGGTLSAQERKNVAGVLALAATHHNLGSIDQVACKEKDFSKVFAIEGDPSLYKNVWAPTSDAKTQSLETSTVAMNQINYDREQQRSQQQVQQNGMRSVTMQ
ncbi:MAG: XVIPCD domain-containing protein [Lysobacter sp.]